MQCSTWNIATTAMFHVEHVCDGFHEVRLREIAQQKRDPAERRGDPVPALSRTATSTAAGFEMTAAATHGTSPDGREGSGRGPGRRGDTAGWRAARDGPSACRRP